MSTAASTPPVCSRCSAPLGVNDRRCPFCGAENVPPLSVPPPAAEPGKAGARTSSSSIPPGALLRGADNRISVPPSSGVPSSRQVVPPPFQGGQVGAIAYTETTREREQRKALAAVKPRRTIDIMEIFGGLVAAFAKGETIDDAFRLAVAAGSAAVMSPGTELGGEDDVRLLLPRVVIADIAAAVA